MANEYLVNSADLTAVADAIRAKGGKSEALSFPDGFVDAVGAIETGSGDPYDVARQIMMGTIEVFSDDVITNVKDGTFLNCAKLTTINAPNIKGIGKLGCSGTTLLNNITTENITGLSSEVFTYSGITELNFPKLTRAYSNCFQYSKSLKKVDIGSSYSWDIEAGWFYADSALETFILRATALIPLRSTNAFTGTLIASGSGYIYVPANLVDTYKAATNWATYAGQIRAIEDYTEITGG